MRVVLLVNVVAMTVTLVDHPLPPGIVFDHSSPTPVSAPDHRRPVATCAPSSLARVTSTATTPHFWPALEPGTAARTVMTRPARHTTERICGATSLGAAAVVGVAAAVVGAALFAGFPLFDAFPPVEPPAVVLVLIVESSVVEVLDRSSDSALKEPEISSADFNRPRSR